MTVEEKKDGGQPTCLITPKTPHSWLVANNVSTDVARRRITEDIIANARELTPGVDWRDIIGSISWVFLYRRYTGSYAINFSTAFGISGVAREMGWDMHAPEVVYMSGSVFSTFLGKRLNLLTSAIDAINEGRNTYPTTGLRDQRLKALDAEVARLAIFKGKIRDSLDAYAEANLPQAKDPAYEEILARFPFTGHDSMRNAKNRAMKAFKVGDLGKARDELRAIKDR